MAWSCGSGVVWITGALVPTGTRLPVWAAALVVDLAAPIAGYRTPGLGRSQTTDWDIEGVHFAERFQAFIIIAPGESIVRTGATASSHGLTSGVVASLAVAFATTAVLWWLYFGNLGPVLGYVQQLAGWHPGRPAGVVELRITHVTARRGTPEDRQLAGIWLLPLGRGQTSQRGFFGREAGFEVLVGGGGVCVPEPEGDDGQIDP